MDESVAFSGWGLATDERVAFAGWVTLVGVMYGDVIVQEMQLNGETITAWEFNS